MTSRPPASALVIPCYNESTRLSVREFLDYLGEHPCTHLAFVDDGSTDKTWTLLEEVQANLPDRITTLRLERNRGKAEAVRRGVLKVLDREPDGHGEFDFVGYWDADLSTPLDALELFLDTFARRPEIKLVMGSRVRLLGRRVVRRPFRHYLGRVFSTLASLSLDLPVYDTQCGAKLFRVDEDLRALFSEPFSDPWLFDVEILARMRIHRGPRASDGIYELPLPVWEDVGGSKVRLRDGGRAALSLAKIWLRRVRGGG
jgi:glycosyltransferase involved in cell wall biosynthesis